MSNGTTYVSLEYADRLPDRMIDPDGTMTIAYQTREKTSTGRTSVGFHMIDITDGKAAGMMGAILPMVRMMRPDSTPAAIPVIPTVSLLKVSHDFPPASTSDDTIVMIGLDPDGLKRDFGKALEHDGVRAGLTILVNGYLKMILTNLEPWRDRLDPMLANAMNTLLHDPELQGEQS
ncbi:hypothetical protein [Bifidobacterium sp. SO1]|uniref:hypothetical protein n=1 Tax=Bifidobacterium sp. SO1 TaxID=2809029 RepID=UPI001BDD43F7|nr:hypothetical protein [Bifidobacterium sp. SO1]MBT1162943.1 hypothetical protein [Bifidobacterium sp. SO1]